MVRKIVMALVSALAVSAGALQAQPASQAQEGAKWIHVRVDEEEGAKVAINLPISLVDVAVDMAKDEAFDKGDFELDRNGKVKIEDLRRMWRELKGAGDAEFVNVQDGDEHVRIYRRGDKVHVQVDEKGQEKVRVELPSSIVDALLSSEGEELNLEAAARELGRIGDQDVVTVNDEGSRVRIWVDSSNTGE